MFYNIYKHKTHISIKSFSTLINISVMYTDHKLLDPPKVMVKGTRAFFSQQGGLQRSYRLCSVGEMQNHTVHHRRKSQKVPTVKNPESP